MSAAAAAQPAAERGLEAFRRRDYAAAEKIFAGLVRANPSNARLHKLLGMTFAAQENWERAEEPFILDPAGAQLLIHHPVPQLIGRHGVRFLGGGQQQYRRMSPRNWRVSLTGRMWLRWLR